LHDSFSFLPYHPDPCDKFSDIDCPTPCQNITTI